MESTRVGKNSIWMKSLLILMSLVLLFELFRDTFKTGDFIGYVNAGNLVIKGKNIYSDILNTWPPFFSIFSVPIAWLDNISPHGVRFVWLVGLILVMKYIVQMSYDMAFSKRLSFSESTKTISIFSPIAVVPLLLGLRFMMDNMANIQINIFLLLGCFLTIYHFQKSNFVIAGIILALIISLKIYPVFLLLFFIFKREYKIVLYTILFILLLNCLSFLVFGIEGGLEYYKVWATEIAPKSFMANHKNQSIFGAFLRLFTTMDPSHDLYFNITNWDPKMVKKATYLVVAAAAIWPAWIFRKKLNVKDKLNTFLQFSIILTIIPVLTPVAWKAYFIFTWPGFLMAYSILFNHSEGISLKKRRLAIILFWISVILINVSADIFVGPRFSDILEAFSAVMIGTISLAVCLIILYTDIIKKPKSDKAESLHL